MAHQSLNSKSRIDIDYNLYFNNTGAKLILYNKQDDWKKLSLSEWQQRLKKAKSISGNDANSIIGSPLFVKVPPFPTGNSNRFNFSLSNSSPAIDAGGPLTTTTSAGTGNKVRVKDSRYFFDGYYIVEGDLIKIGNNSPTRIKNIDYKSNIIEISNAINWQKNAPVNLQYTGSAPDIGAGKIEATTQSDSLRPPTTLIIKSSS